MNACRTGKGPRETGKGPRETGSVAVETAGGPGETFDAKVSAQDTVAQLRGVMHTNAGEPTLGQVMLWLGMPLDGRESVQTFPRYGGLFRIVDA